MKAVKLVKNWKYTAWYSRTKITWKKGMIIKLGKGTHIIKGEGLYIPNFYSYGQAELIPKKYYKEL
jgi:hypothetical protein